MDERRLEQNQAAARDNGWIAAGTVERIRRLVAGYLDGRREVDAEVEALAAELAAATREAQFTPERMLIGMRALWRDFTVSQHDRLQLASLYDRLVRRAIDRYYED